MKITYLDRARFHVESETDASEPPYLVDLLEYRLNGWCDCRNFAIYIQALWESGKTPPEKQCKHIRAIWTFLVDQTLKLAGKGKVILRANQNQRRTIRNRILQGMERIELMAQHEVQKYGATI